MPSSVTYSLQVCPRCRQSFECKATEIGVCQCSAIRLSKELSESINEQYPTCLCINCLQALKNDTYIAAGAL